MHISSIVYIHISFCGTSACHVPKYVHKFLSCNRAAEEGEEPASSKEAPSSHVTGKQRTGVPFLASMDGARSISQLRTFVCIPGFWESLGPIFGTAL